MDLYMRHFCTPQALEILHSQFQTSQFSSHFLLFFSHNRLLSVRRKFRLVSVTVKTSQLECRLESVMLITNNIQCRLSCRVGRHNLWMNIKSRSFRWGWRRKSMNNSWSRVCSSLGLGSEEMNIGSGWILYPRSRS